MTKKIVLEIDENDAKAALILQLQEALTRRNAEIDSLKQRLDAGEGSEYAKRQYELGYKRGWTDSAGVMMEQTRQASRFLTETHEGAFKVYLQGDRLTVAGQRVSR